MQAKLAGCMRLGGIAFLAGCYPRGLSEHHELCDSYVGPEWIQPTWENARVVLDLTSERRTEASLDDWHYLFVDVRSPGLPPALSALWEWPATDIETTASPAEESAILWEANVPEVGRAYEVTVRAEWSTRADRLGYLAPCDLAFGFLEVE